MKVLVACEESQVVTKAFRDLGHEAYSCDLQDCSGGHPEWHIKKDVRQLLKVYFDLVIFHPDCTYITNSGVRWLKRGNGFDYERMIKLQQATEFFNLRHKFNSPKVATENPIPHKYAVEDGYGVVGIGAYDQLIQPWQFGHGETKATCLWLKGLPKLIWSNDNTLFDKKSTVLGREGRIWKMSPGPDRAKMRSKTYEGIAKAMAQQWGGLLKEKAA